MFLTKDKLTVTLVFEDFEPALRKAGIDPTQITEYEWSKFTDDFLTGTHWDDVAEIAADCLLLRRAGLPENT